MPAAPRPVALSFSGGGLLLTYHLGMASYLLRPDGPLRPRVTRFVGVSGGALAATACALLGPEALLGFAVRYACRGQAWSGLLNALQVGSPGLGVGQHADDHAARPQGNALGEGSASRDSHSRTSGAHGGADAAARLSDVLYIGATECSTGRAVLFSRFGSNEQIARCLLASCAIPASAHPLDLLRSRNTYPDTSGVVVPPACEWDGGPPPGAGAAAMPGAGGRLPWSPHGVAYVDGGLSAAAPLLPHALRCHTLTISPIAGPRGVIARPRADRPAHLHLCPSDASLRVPLVAPALAGMRCYLSAQNLRALSASVHAPPEALKGWYERGAADAELFERGMREEDLP